MLHLSIWKVLINSLPVFFPIKCWLHWVNYGIMMTNWWFLSSYHGSYYYEWEFFCVELSLVHRGYCWPWAIFYIIDAGWRISLWWGLGHTALGIWGSGHTALGIWDIVSWRSLRKWRKQEGHSDLSPTSLSWKGNKTFKWEVPPLSLS